MEHPTPNGLIALCVITYFYFGTKRKSALACHAMSLTHIAYLLRRKRVTLDPLLNQTLLFFEKVRSPRCSGLFTPSFVSLSVPNASVTFASLV